MNAKDHKMKVSKFLDMIDNRLERVSHNYSYGAESKDKISAQVMAETKWQLAELKMILIDEILSDIEGKL